MAKTTKGSKDIVVTNDVPTIQSGVYIHKISKTLFFVSDNGRGTSSVYSNYYTTEQAQGVKGKSVIYMNNAPFFENLVRVSNYFTEKDGYATILLNKNIPIATFANYHLAKSFILSLIHEKESRDVFLYNLGLKDAELVIDLKEYGPIEGCYLFLDDKIKSTLSSWAIIYEKHFSK